MVIKRVFDLMLASFVLAADVLPLFPLVALVIKLDSPGPIFFKQMRVGRGGKPFKIIKFRSMRQDAEAKTGAVWAQTQRPAHHPHRAASCARAAWTSYPSSGTCLSAI